MILLVVQKQKELMLILLIIINYHLAIKDAIPVILGEVVADIIALHAEIPVHMN